jgi:hypothetical protein
VLSPQAAEPAAMGSRFDDEHTILNPSPADWRLGQGDTQRSARLRQHLHALVLDQQDQALVDQQVAFGRAVVQPHEAVSLEHVKPGDCLDLEVAIRLQDPDRRSTHIVEGGQLD